MLLLEGTRVTSSGDDGRAALSEADLERALAKRFRATEGIGIVLASGQNLDRVVTTYRAALRAGRTLVIDLYTATLLRATGRSTMPQPETHKVRIYIPIRQRVLVKESREFERTKAVAGYRVYPEELAESSSSFAFVAQTSTLSELGRAGCLAGASATWSMWAGYLNAKGGRAARELLGGYDVPLQVLHASDMPRQQTCTRWRKRFMHRGSWRFILTRRNRRPGSFRLERSERMESGGQHERLAS